MQLCARVPSPFEVSKVRVELHDQLEQHKASSSKTAAAKVAVLKEEQNYSDLRSESLLLESKLKEQRQQSSARIGTPRRPIPSPEKSDVEAYNRLSYRRPNTTSHSVGGGNNG